MDCSPLLLCPCNSPGKNTEVGCHSLCQGIFLTQGSNPGPLHCRQILYCLSHQGSSYIHKHTLSNTLLPFITLNYYVLDQLRIRKISFYFAFSYWFFFFLLRFFFFGFALHQHESATGYWFFDAFPFCMQIQISIVYHFPSLWKGISYKAGVLATNSLSFCCLKMSLFSFTSEG